jgi:ribosome maturation factor RimP
MPATVSDNITERVRSIAEEVVAGPLFVVDVIVRGQKGSRVVDVYVDSDAPLTVDDLAAASREIGFLLDSEDVIDGKYSLNVSSPGVDRPLTIPRQFRKNTGRLVLVKRKATGAGALRGKLVNADEEGFELQLENAETKRIMYDEASSVKVLLPW